MPLPRPQPSAQDVQRAVRAQLQQAGMTEEQFRERVRAQPTLLRGIVTRDDVTAARQGGLMAKLWPMTQPVYKRPAIWIGAGGIVLVGVISWLLSADEDEAEEPEEAAGEEAG